MKRVYRKDNGCRHEIGEPVRVENKFDLTGRAKCIIAVSPEEYRRQMHCPISVAASYTMEIVSLCQKRYIDREYLK